jgi:predicted lipoprotein with Yx(FWY)xxD motif
MLVRTTIAVMLTALLAAACGAAPPAATPSAAAPTDVPVQGIPTAAAATPTMAAPATPTPNLPDPYDYGYGDDDPTPPPATATPAPPAATAEITLAAAGHLLGPADLALYTFDNDSVGSSSCTGSCAGAWPPLIVDETETPTYGEGIDGELGVIERADGTSQVTYNGAPLYYYAGDQGPTDTTGDGIGGVWHLAQP